MFGKRELTKVYEHTESFCQEHFDEMSKPETKINDENILNRNLPDDVETPVKTVIDVVNEDTLDAAIRLKKAGFKKPLVLNMASDVCPGGGVRKGCRAQEECIFRRTNAHMAIHNRLGNKFGEELYPFNKNIVVEWTHGKRSRRSFKTPVHYDGSTILLYTTDVTIFKDSQYNLLEKEKWETVDIISIAGIRNPDTVTNPETGLEELWSGDEKLMRKKIESMLQVAMLKGHDSIVLGAIGCGAFRGPPEHISQIFDEILNENRELFGRKGLKNITFAVLSNPYAEYSNYTIFKENCYFE